MMHDPQPGDMFATAKGRTVEIIHREVVANAWTEEVDVIAYRYLGATQVHLRSVDNLGGWVRVFFE